MWQQQQLALRMRKQKVAPEIVFEKSYMWTLKPALNYTFVFMCMCVCTCMWQLQNIPLTFVSWHLSPCCNNFFVAASHCLCYLLFACHHWILLYLFVLKFVLCWYYAYGRLIATAAARVRVSLKCMYTPATTWVCIFVELLWKFRKYSRAIGFLLPTPVHLAKSGRTNKYATPHTRRAGDCWQSISHAVG